MASYADIARQNNQQWDVNNKKKCIVEKLVKNSKRIRRGIKLYFFGQWKKYVMWCSICMEGIGINGRKLECGHYFHSECITRWCKGWGSCPNCRTTIRSI